MSDGHALPSRGGSDWRDNLRDAVRYWESLRLLYNLILAAVCLAWLLLTWPHFRPALTLQSLFPITILAVLANLCYCAAYLPELLLQNSTYRTRWRGRRWAVWLAGMALALVLSNYWIADEIYPYVPYVP